VKQHYLVSAVVHIGHAEAEEPLAFTVEVCVPYDQVRAHKDPTMVQADLRVKVLRHLIHCAVFDNRDGYKDLAAIFAKGQESYTVSFTGLEYRIISEYRQWLATEYPADLPHLDLMASGEIERAAEVRTMAASMLQFREMYHGTVSCLEALMNAKTPLWDGDVPSKAGRDSLLDLNLAVRVIFNGADGYTAATYLGREVMNEIYRLRLIKEQEGEANATSTEGNQVAGGTTSETPPASS
jgi:hypothetical protein